MSCMEPSSQLQNTSAGAETMVDNFKITQYVTTILSLLQIKLRFYFILFYLLIFWSFLPSSTKAKALGPVTLQ